MGIFRQFPYSNFHEMNMDEIIKIMRQMQDEWAATKDEWQSMQDFINDYFNNLDVSAEVLAAMRVFAQDGTLAAVIDPTIATSVSAWLAEHITPTTPAVDASFTVEGAAADSKKVGDTVLHYVKTQPATYESLLANIDVPLIFSIAAADAWSDKPANGIVINQIYYVTTTNQPYVYQTVIGYPGFKKYERVVVNKTPQSNWIESDPATSMRLLTINAANYDNNIAKINITGFFNASHTQGWSDLPIANFTGLIINFNYAAYGNVQIAVRYEGAKSTIFVRFTNPSTGAPLGYGWQKIITEYEYNDILKFMTVSPANYDNYIAKVPNGFFLVTSGDGWLDLPENGFSGLIVSFKYSDYGIVQLAFRYQAIASKMFLRYANPSTGAGLGQNWKPVPTGNMTDVYYAIGDSITSGSWSDSNGGHVATNADWAYPNTLGRQHACTVHNLAVPGAKITEYSAQANAVNADATLVTISGGANDYYGSNAKPLGTAADPADYNTICGALKSIITVIADRAPNARIVLISPFIIKYGSISTKWSLNFEGPNGFSYADLAEQMKAIAELYNIEFVDGTRTGPVNTLNIESVEMDNVHPTKEFYTTISNWIGSKLF